MTHRDKKAFLKMIGENQGAILRICLMFSHDDRDRLQDLYQDIVCRLWEAWPTYEGRAKPSTWLYRVAWNEASDSLRSQTRKVPLLTLPPSVMEMIEQETDSDLVDRLYRLADRLSPDEKMLLRLYLDKFRLKDIAIILGITENAVKHRIQNMKKHLIEFNKEEQ